MLVRINTAHRMPIDGHLAVLGGERVFCSEFKLDCACTRTTCCQAAEVISPGFEAHRASLELLVRVMADCVQGLAMPRRQEARHVRQCLRR